MDARILRSAAGLGFLALLVCSLVLSAMAWTTTPVAASGGTLDQHVVAQSQASMTAEELVEAPHDREARHGAEMEEMTASEHTAALVNYGDAGYLLGFATCWVMLNGGAR